MVYTEAGIRLLALKSIHLHFFRLPWSEALGRSDPWLLHIGQRRAREADKLNQTKPNQTKHADHPAGKVLGRTSSGENHTHSARASCQLGVVMQEHTEHVGASVASLSGLLVDKFGWFQSQRCGNNCCFFLDACGSPKAYRDNACPGLCQQNVLYGITTKCSSVSLFPTVWFLQLISPLLPRKSRGSESNTQGREFYP